MNLFYHLPETELSCSGTWRLKNVYQHIIKEWEGLIILTPSLRALWLSPLG